MGHSLGLPNLWSSLTWGNKVQVTHDPIYCNHLLQLHKHVTILSATSVLNWLVRGQLRLKLKQQSSPRQLVALVIGHVTQSEFPENLCHSDAVNVQEQL